MVRLYFIVLICGIFISQSGITDDGLESSRYTSLHTPNTEWNPGQIINPDPVHKVTRNTLNDINENTQTIIIEMDEGFGIKNRRWSISEAHKGVFFRRLETIDEIGTLTTGLNIIEPKTKYKGLKIHITDKVGDSYETLYVYHSQIRNSEGDTLFIDHDRQFEYWLWGSNQNFNNRMRAIKTLPIFTYHQCTLLGNQIVETTPKQCLMPNQDIFLDIKELPTQKSLNTQSFDGCLSTGRAIINTFPRRCIVAGGHVFTEPPRIPILPAKSKKFSGEDFGF